MMGRSHMLLGTAGWLAVGAPLLEAAGDQMSAPELLAGTVVCAGASLLPDLDHPSGTMARSLGPVTKIISKATAAAAGGHRNGTHSLLFCGAVGFGTAIGLAASRGGLVPFIIALFCAALMIRTLGDIEGLAGASLAALIGLMVVVIAPNSDWIWVAIVAGCLLHLLGDFLTPEGIPLFWPISKIRFKIPVIGRTGDWRESLIAGACALVACVQLIDQANVF